MRKLMIFTLLVLWSNQQLRAFEAYADSSLHIGRNTIFLEAFGSGGYCSLNYQRMLNSWFAARIGVGYGSLGTIPKPLGWPDYSSTFLKTIEIDRGDVWNGLLMFSYCSSLMYSGLELGLGASIIHESGNLHQKLLVYRYHAQQYGYEVIEVHDYSEIAVSLNASVGYRYQFPSGVFLRAAWTPMIRLGGDTLWQVGGISFGWTF